MNICLASQLLHCILAWLKHCIEQHPGQDCNFPLIIHNLHVFRGFESSKEQYELKKHLKDFQEGCILQQESGYWMTMMRLNKATTQQ